MSVIVAVRKNNKTVIAADTQWSMGSVKLSGNLLKNPAKILKMKDSYVGLAGSVTHGLVFRSLNENHADKINFDSEYEVFETMRKLHEILKTEYFVMTGDSDEEQPYESNQINALIANKNGIFELQTYREVIEFDRYCAIGAGYRFAIGAMHALYDKEEDPLEIALAGIRAACEFEESCGLPFEFYVIE